MLQKLIENKRFLYFLILFVLVFWIVQIGFTFEHETTHRHICKNHREDNATIYTNYSFAHTSGATHCSGTTTERELELHSQAEVVGYHTSALIYALFGGIFLLVVYWELRR